MINRNYNLWPKSFFFSILIFFNFTLYNSVSGQWIQTPGPMGGNTIGFTAVSDTLYIYNGAFIASGSYPQTGTFFRSIDYGNSWQADTIGLHAPVASMCKIGDTLIASVYPQGLYRKVGSAWTNINPTYPTSTIFAHHGILYLSHWGNIDRSIDRGATMIPSIFGISPNTQVIKFDVINDTIYAASDKAIYKYNNSWWENKIQDNFIGITHNQNGIFVTNTSGYIFKSVDSGLNWDTLQTQGLNYMADDIISIGDTLLMIAKDTSNTTLRTYIYRSFDDGITWNICWSGLRDNDLNRLTNIGNKIFVSCHDGGSVYKSVDFGDSWQDANQGLANTRVIQLHYKNGELFSASVSPSGIHKSLDNAESWFSSGSGMFSTVQSSLFASLITSNSSFVFAGTYGNGLFRSSDDGATWQLISNWPTGINTNYISGLYATDSILLVGSIPNFYRSIDNGTTWDTIPFSPPFIVSFTKFANKIFAGTFRLGVYESIDDGLTWTSIGTGLTPNKAVNKIIVRNNELTAATEDGVFTSADTGATWQRIGFGILPNQNASSIDGRSDTLVVTFNPVNYYGSIYITYDNGVTWSSYDRPGYPFQINDLLIVGDTIFAATNSYSVWKRSLSDVILNSNISLFSAEEIKAFPNPSSTLINFTIPEIGNEICSIKIYDMTGKIIYQSIVSSTSFQFNVSDFMNGVFLLAVTTNDKIITKIFIVQK